jgi:hypothetical protein
LLATGLRLVRFPLLFPQIPVLLRPHNTNLTLTYTIGSERGSERQDRQLLIRELRWNDGASIRLSAVNATKEVLSRESERSNTFEVTTIEIA